LPAPVIPAKAGIQTVLGRLDARCLRRLDALDQAESLMELNVPGFDFHSLRGIPKR